MKEDKPKVENIEGKDHQHFETELRDDVSVELEHLESDGLKNTTEKSIIESNVLDKDRDSTSPLVPDSGNKAHEVDGAKLPRLLSKQMMPVFLSCCLVYSCATMNGFDGSLMSSIYTSPEYIEFYNEDPSSAGTGLVFSIYNLGQIVGAFFISIQDWKGRKVGLLVGCTGTVVGAVITAVAKNQSTMVGGRFFMSTFSTIALAAGPTYCAEVAPHHLRGKIGGLYNTLWWIGSIVAAFTAYGASKSQQGSLLAFRLPLWIQVLFPGLVCVFGWFIPESPRWLIGVERYDDARDMIVKYHCNGDENHPLVELEMAEITDSFKHVNFSNPWKILDIRPLFTKRSDRYRLFLVVCMAWFGQFSGNNVVSYFLPTMLSNVGMTDHSTNVLMNGVNGIVSWGASVLGSLVHDKVGRRKMFLGSILGSSLALTGLSICTARFQITGEHSATIGTLFFIYLFGAIFSFAFTPMQPIYPTEVSSNVLRSRIMVVNYVVSGAASFINQFSAPVAMDRIGYWYYVVYVLWDLVEFTIIYFFFVETRYKSLEEMDEIFHAKSPRKASVANYNEDDGNYNDDGNKRKKLIIKLCNKFISEKAKTQKV